MKDKKTYTFDAILERLMLTDEEVLLCKQHKEYGKKLDKMLDNTPLQAVNGRPGRVFGIKKREPSDERMEIIGQNGNDGLHYDSIGNIGDPPDEPKQMKWKNRGWGKYEHQEYE